MLKAKVVAAGIVRNRAPARSEILDQIDVFVPELHAHNPHSGTENTFKMLVFIAVNFRVGDFVKGKPGVEVDGAVHVTDRKPNSIDGDGCVSEGCPGKK